MKYITQKWLKDNGHDEEWLANWLAEPQIDKEAVREWFEVHKYSDPRLFISSVIYEDDVDEAMRAIRTKGRRASQRRSRKIRERARKRTPFPCSPTQKLARLALFNGRCAYCDASGRMTMDHVVPLVKGGLDEAVNLVPACVKCNCSKHARPAWEWYQAQPFFQQRRWEKIVQHCQSKIGPALLGPENSQ